MAATPGMPSTHRYFFAIFPDDDARQLTALRAAELQQALGFRGQLVAGHKLHATCHFIGSYPQRRADIEAAALASGDAVTGPPFFLVFDSATSFGGKRRSAPFVLEALAPPDALVRLEQRLKESMSRAGVAPEARPFRPHVTLSYSTDAVPAQLTVEPVAWTVAAYCLVHSVTGTGGYEVLRTWPLLAPASSP